MIPLFIVFQIEILQYEIKWLDTNLGKRADMIKQEKLGHNIQYSCFAFNQIFKVPTFYKFIKYVELKIRE